MLVVDGNPVDAHLAIRELERAGWAVDARRLASVDALESELDRPYDVLLGDPGCLDEAFDALVSRVRACDAALPIIALTKGASTAEVGEWVAGGAADVVDKRDLPRLALVVAQVVGRTPMPPRITHPVSPAIGRASSDLLLTLDAEGTILFANERWETRLGYPPDTLFGRTVQDLVALDTRRGLDKALRAATRAATTRAAVAFLDAEGGRVALESTWVARYDHGGLRGIDGVLVDPESVHDRQGAAPLQRRYEALERQAKELSDHNRRLRIENRDLSSRFEALDAAWRDLDERLELAGATADDGLWDWRLDDDRVFYSARWSEVVGTGAAAMISTPDEWFRRVHEEDLDALDTAIEAHLSGDAPAIDVEFRMIGDDGETRRLRCRGVARRDPAGNPVRVAGSLIPVLVRETSDHPAVLDRVAFEHDLQNAIARGELSLRYQPIIDPSTGALHELEALIRWEHPTRGSVSPAAFIPAAETLGLIEQIGVWTLREACRAMAAWRKAELVSDEVRVAVNLSAQQFTDPMVCSLVETTLRETGLPATALTLEVTESALLESTEATARVLRTLRELGVSVSIDDFGTGYSSLSYLHQFPSDTLKIDRSFVMAMTQDPRHEAIVRALITLGESLGMHVIAEGVETEDQLDALCALGCPAIQGFLIARPLRDEEIQRALPNASWRAVTLAGSQRSTPSS
jgi:PAS domain S-box-containing protein